MLKTDRRSSYDGVLAILLGALALVSIGPARAAAPPNVVLIVADDFGWRDYHFQGHPHVQTPHLDRLASESLVFTRGYVPASLCSPSLASLITGRYPHQHGIFCNDPPAASGAETNRPSRRDEPEFRAGRARLNERMARAETLPRLLAAQGYDCLQTGKWWQGAAAVAGFTAGMTHGDEQRGGRHGDAGLAIGRTSLAPIAEFLDGARQSSRPFFVWYAPMLPHQPHDAPERLVALYRDQTPSETVARYWANVTWFDESCGALLAMLDERGLRDNTLVVYLADNGWIQDPQAARYAPRSKQSPYDGGLRTPIMLRWPGHIEPGRDDMHLASSLDVLPTVLHAVGGALPAELPGLDLLDPQAVAAREAIFGEIFLHTARSLDDPAASLRYRWVIAGDWKLIVPSRANEPEAKIELFDVRQDPDEQHNLAAAEPEKAAELLERVTTWWTVPATAVE